MTITFEINTSYKENWTPVIIPINNKPFILELAPQFLSKMLPCSIHGARRYHDLACLDTYCYMQWVGYETTYHIFFSKKQKTISLPLSVLLETTESSEGPNGFNSAIGAFYYANNNRVNIDKILISPTSSDDCEGITGNYLIKKYQVSAFYAAHNHFSEVKSDKEWKSVRFWDYVGNLMATDVQAKKSVEGTRWAISDDYTTVTDKHDNSCEKVNATAQLFLMSMISLNCYGSGKKKREYIITNKAVELGHEKGILATDTKSLPPISQSFRERCKATNNKPNYTFYKTLIRNDRNGCYWLELNINHPEEIE